MPKVCVRDLQYCMHQVRSCSRIDVFQNFNGHSGFTSLSARLRLVLFSLCSLMPSSSAVFIFPALGSIGRTRFKWGGSFFALFFRTSHLAVPPRASLTACF